MLRLFEKTIVIIVLALASTSFGISAGAAQEPQVRVIVPDHPEGVIVNGCYRTIGTIYGGYRLEICLRQRATFAVTGQGIRCEGRLNWDVAGLGINVALRRTSCGNNVAWSADTMWCRPNLLLGIIGAILNVEDPLLSGLTCDYRPAAGSGQGATQITLRRIT